MKEKIINDKYTKDLIEKFDDRDKNQHYRKANFNIRI